MHLNVFTLEDRTSTDNHESYNRLPELSPKTKARRNSLGFSDQRTIMKESRISISNSPEILLPEPSFDNGENPRNTSLPFALPSIEITTSHR